MKLKRILLLIGGLVCLSACKTIPEPKDGCIYVMVYDYNNAGIKDVTISVDDKVVGKSDVYGRFVYSCNESSKKSCSITLSKEGYESVSEDVKISADLVLYYKLYDAEAYGIQAEKYCDEKNYDLALSSIDKALNISNRDDFNLLKAVILKKMGNEKELKKQLNSISRSDIVDLLNEMGTVNEN